MHRSGLVPLAPAAQAKALARAAKAKAKAKARIESRLQNELKFYDSGSGMGLQLPTPRQWTHKLLDADVIVVPSFQAIANIRDERGRLPMDVFVAILLGRRIAIPAYCRDLDVSKDTSIKFQPLTRTTLGVYFDPGAQEQHRNLFKAVRKAAALPASKWSLLPDAASQRAWAGTGKAALTVKKAKDLHNLARQEYAVDRACSGKGSCWVVQGA